VEKQVPVWNIVHFRNTRPSHCFFFICVYSSLRIGEHCKFPSRSGLSQTDRRFLVHSELKITLPLRALMKKNSNNHIPKFSTKTGMLSLSLIIWITYNITALHAPWPILALRHTGLVFLIERKWRCGFERAGEGSAGIAYRPIPSHLPPWTSLFLM